MYYIEDRGYELSIHEARTGAPYFQVYFNGELEDYNLSNNILSLSYVDGNIEVYDLETRSRIR